MTSKAYAVRGYVRSAPRDPYAEVRAAKTEQLRSQLAHDRDCIESLPDHPEWQCVEMEIVRDFWRYTMDELS